MSDRVSRTHEHNILDESSSIKGHRFSPTALQTPKDNQRQPLRLPFGLDTTDDGDKLQSSSGDNNNTSMLVPKQQQVVLQCTNDVQYALRCLLSEFVTHSYNNFGYLIKQDPVSGSLVGVVEIGLHTNCGMFYMSHLPYGDDPLDKDILTVLNDTSSGNAPTIDLHAWMHLRGYLYIIPEVGHNTDNTVWQYPFHCLQFRSWSNKSCKHCPPNSDLIFGDGDTAGLKSSIERGMLQIAVDGRVASPAPLCLDSDPRRPKSDCHGCNLYLQAVQEYHQRLALKETFWPETFINFQVEDLDISQVNVLNFDKDKLGPSESYEDFFHRTRAEDKFRAHQRKHAVVFPPVPPDELLSTVEGQVVRWLVYGSTFCDSVERGDRVATRRVWIDLGSCDKTVQSIQSPRFRVIQASVTTSLTGGPALVVYVSKSFTCTFAKYDKQTKLIHWPSSHNSCKSEDKKRIAWIKGDLGSPDLERQVMEWLQQLPKCTRFAYGIGTTRDLSTEDETIAFGCVAHLGPIAFSQLSYDKDSNKVTCVVDDVYNHLLRPFVPTCF